MGLNYSTLFPIILYNNNIGNNTRGVEKLKFPQKISMQLYEILFINNTYNHIDYKELAYNLIGHKFNL